MEYASEKTLFKNIGNYSANNLDRTLVSIDSTVIDLRTIDTSLYSDKYELWQEIDVSEGDMHPLVLGDVNKNGRAEIYGYGKSYDNYYRTPASIFEIDSLDVFHKVYQFPDTIYFAQQLFDVDKDGNDEAFMFMQNGRGGVFRSNIQNQLPTIYCSGFNRSIYQYYNPTLIDLDKNGQMDLIYGDESYIYIDEYNPRTVSFDSVC